MADNKDLVKKEVKKVYKAPEKGKVMFIPNGKGKTFSREEPKDGKKALLIKLDVGKGIVVSEEDGKAMQKAGFGKIKVVK